MGYSPDSMQFATFRVCGEQGGRFYCVGGIGASEASMIRDVDPGAYLVGFNLIICIITLSNQLFLLSIHSQEEGFDDNSISLHAITLLAANYFV